MLFLSRQRLQNLGAFQPTSDRVRTTCKVFMLDGSRWATEQKSCSAAGARQMCCMKSGRRERHSSATLAKYRFGRVFRSCRHLSLSHQQLVASVTIAMPRFELDGQRSEHWVSRWDRPLCKVVTSLPCVLDTTCFLFRGIVDCTGRPKPSRKSSISALFFFF